MTLCTVMPLSSTVQWWPCQEDIQHSVHKSFYHLQNGDDLSIIPIIRLMKHCTFRMVTISPKCHALSNLLTEMLHIWAQFTWLPHLHQRCCGQTASHPPPSALVASAQPVSEVKRTCVCYADSNTMWSTELSSGKVLSAISVVFLTCTTTTTRYNWSYYPSIQTCNNTTKCCSWCVAALGLMLGVFSGACVLVGRGIYFYFYFLLLCWLPYWLRFYTAGCVNLGVWFTNAWMLLCLKTD